MATSMLQILNPVMPRNPSTWAINPPITAPAMPKIISRNHPSPWRFTNRLAMNPAIRPKIIHAMIPMTRLLPIQRSVAVAARQGGSTGPQFHMMQKLLVLLLRLRGLGRRRGLVHARRFLGLIRVGLSPARAAVELRRLDLDGRFGRGLAGH